MSPGMSHVSLGTDVSIDTSTVRLFGLSELVKIYATPMVFGGLGLLATGTVSIPIILRLASGMPARWWDEPRRWFCAAVVLMSPIVISLLQFLTVVFPDHVRTLLVTVALWEGLAILCIFLLLLSYLGTSWKEQLNAFEQLEPARLMWMDLKKPTASDLMAIWVLVLQFVVFNPINAIIEASAVEPKSLFIVLRICSLVLMVYAIVVLIEMGKGPLATRRAHQKFWSLKGLIIATMLIHRLLQRFAYDSHSAVKTAGAVSSMVAAPFAIMLYLACPSKDFAASEVFMDEENAKEQHTENANEDDCSPKAVKEDRPIA